jgi:PAS domain S-box-containing protein
MALLDLKGRFLHVNRSLCQIVGYSEAELLARTFQDITYPDDLDPDLSNMHRLLSGEIASYQMEKRYFHKEGFIIWIQLTGSVVRDARGRPLHFIAQVQDVTEQKRAVEGERLLSQASAQLAVSLDPDDAAASVARLSVPALGDLCLLGLLEEDGQVHMMDAAIAGSGMTERLRQAIASAGKAAWRGPAIEQALRTGVPVLLHGNAQETIAALSGEEGLLPLLRDLGPHSCLIAPLVACRRTLGVLVLLACDPHHRYDSRDAELAAAMGRRAALAVDNGRLFRASQEATRLRDEVLRVVAHDLRNPLNGILLSAESMLGFAPSGSAAREPLERIRRLVMRANRLIQDLLDVARMEAGKLSVEARSEEVAPLVRDAVELHRVLADDRRIHLAVEVPDGLPSIHADRDRLLQALSNLLGNAIKFTPGGGRITVRAERAGVDVRISVIDTGPGISAEEIPHLFDPFWQARKGAQGGAGLGLPIVKGIVEAHRGAIQVTSEVGAGSTFSMTLPAVLPAPPSRPAVDSPSGPVI